MSWDIYPAKQLFLDHRETWQRLNREHCQAHPLLDIKFIEPAFEYFGNDRVLLAVECVSGVAVNAALLEQLGKGNWQLFLPSQQPLGPAIFSRGSDSAALHRSLRGLAAALPGYPLILGFLKQDSGYSALCAADGLSFMERVDDVETINIVVNQDFDIYWQSRSRKLVKEMRRKFRKVEQDGIELRLVELRDYSQMATAVAQHGDIESSGWKGKKGTAIHHDNVQGHFYTKVMENFSKEGGARAYQLYFNDKIAASLLTIVQQGMMVVLKTAHDESMSIYAPGRLIDYKMLEGLFSGGDVTNIEMYTNASLEDKRWCTDSRNIYHLNYYRSGISEYLIKGTRKIKAIKKNIL